MSKSTTPRRNAWQELGQTIRPSATAQQTLEDAGLAGWNVRKSPLRTASISDTDGNGASWTKTLEVPGQYAIVRDTPDGSESLGVVGRHYYPVQNEDQISLLEAIVDESGAQFETAGQLGGGRQVFVTMKLPESIKVGGEDQVDLYLAAFNSHDGQSSFRFVITPVRVWCANMQAAVTKSALASFTSRHTAGGAPVAIAAARDALKLSFDYASSFQAEADRMIAQEYTNQAFSRLTASLFPTPEFATEKKAETQATHRDALTALWRESDTATTLEPTRWRAYQAVTEYMDHVVTRRNKFGDFLREARALDSISDRSVSTKIKQRAFQLLTK